MAHITGTTGNDRGATALQGTDGSDVIEGLAGHDYLYGNGGNDDLYGQDGNDVMDGGAGADRMYGGLGRDVYYVDNGGDLVVEVANQGLDTVIASRAYMLTDNVEKLILTGTASVAGTGNRLDNLIIGNAGNNELAGGVGDDTLMGGAGHDTLDGGNGRDVLNGGSGGDIMRGGAGDDTYYVNNSGDVVVENANGGHDTVIASGNYTMTANVEDLMLSDVLHLDGSGLTGSGNSLDNHITSGSGSNFLRGFDGNDVLDAGSGADTLYGGKGDDTFYVDNTGDKVIEYTGQGNDRVISSVSFTLGGAVENLTLTGAGDIDGTGNALDNHLTGNSGNNVLDGKAGADIMSGGGGNDVYLVDNVADVIVESVNGGDDRVMSFVSYVLSTGVDSLDLEGAKDLNGTGNGLANHLTGNLGNNVLDGKAGADVMAGGGGDDTYYVDNAGDVVTENAGEGQDTVHSTISYILGDALETLTLGGTANIDGTGNGLDNRLTGNAGDNVLDGKAGNDLMVGGAGNDTYFVDSTNDRIIERAGGGIDTVNAVVRPDTAYTLSANIENLNLFGPLYAYGVGAIGNASDNVMTLAVGIAHSYLAGMDGNDDLVGNTGNDTLVGGQGDDVMVGGNGEDQLIGEAGDDVATGGLGADQFYFDHLDAIGHDVITDFSTAQGDNLLLGHELIFLAETPNVTRVGADVVIDFGNNQTITLKNETATLSDIANHMSISGLHPLIGTQGDDSLSGGGSGVVFGGAGNDILRGGQYTSYLNGGSGADTMYGNSGNDSFIVDNSGDVVIESGGGGPNSVVTSYIDYALGGTIVRLALMGTANLSGTGNSADNVLAGNAGDNVLDGRDGADMVDYTAVTAAVTVDLHAGIATGADSGIDTLVSIEGIIGGSGNDVLKASDFDATLNGGAGDDILTGGAGNDVLIGGKGDNILDGGAGADTMRGGYGNDIFYVDNIGDVVSDSQDNGIIYASVSYSVRGTLTLQLTGSQDLSATGSTKEAVSTLIGNAGINHLDGMAGADILTGGAGADEFFYTASQIGLAERITDFSAAEGDTIHIAGYDPSQHGGAGPLVFQSGADVIVQIDGGHYIVVANTTYSADFMNHVVIDG